MNVIPTKIKDIIVIEPSLFTDERGFLYESYNSHWWQSTGIAVEFVQENHSRSTCNVLRGLHYQIQQPQGKLVRAIIGQILDVAVDLRKSSPTFGQWVSCVLSYENKRLMWIPPGFAHGFLVFSDVAEVVYKMTNYYAPQHERCIIWNDPTLAIDWHLSTQPVLSAKDQAGKLFKLAEVYP
jgi:dTDP-4-dehydrorhamnose 3,5-epimerase